MITNGNSSGNSNSGNSSGVSGGIVDCNSDGITNLTLSPALNLMGTCHSVASECPYQPASKHRRYQKPSTRVPRRRERERERESVVWRACGGGKSTRVLVWYGGYKIPNSKHKVHKFERQAGKRQPRKHHMHLDPTHLG
jgi:hypothetical protein